MIAATIGMNTSIVTGKLSANARLNESGLASSTRSHAASRRSRTAGLTRLGSKVHSRSSSSIIDAEGLLFRRNGSAWLGGVRRRAEAPCVSTAACSAPSGASGPINARASEKTTKNATLVTTYIRNGGVYFARCPSR